MQPLNGFVQGSDEFNDVTVSQPEFFKISPKSQSFPNRDHKQKTEKMFS